MGTTNHEFRPSITVFWACAGFGSGPARESVTEAKSRFLGKKCKGVPAVSIHFQNGLRKAIKSHGAVISFVTKLSSGINWTHKMRAYTDIKKNAAR